MTDIFKIKYCIFVSTVPVTLPATSAYQGGSFAIILPSG